MRPLIFVVPTIYSRPGTHAASARCLYRDASTPHRQSSAARGAAAPVRRGRVHIAIGAQERAACIGGPQHTVKAHAPGGAPRAPGPRGPMLLGDAVFALLVDPHLTHATKIMAVSTR